MPSTPVTLFTTPGCPDCRAVRAWLDQRHVHYTERDLSDPAVMAQAKERYGVRIAPITVVGDAFFYGTFDQQRPRLTEALLDPAAD